MTVFVGTSGWQYDDWDGRFYPDEVAKKRWLEHFAERFAGVEVNNTFYRLPKRSTFEAWAERTPDDFVIAPKMSRFLTHVKRLKDPVEPVKRFFEHARGLGRKLGPVLVQLPPNFHADDRLDTALGEVPGDVRVAVEFRHGSWFDDEVYAVLSSHDAALVLADQDSRPAGPIEQTAGWAYLRMHAGRADPEPCYGRTSLEHWAERLAERWPRDADRYVFFNNDTHGCAVRDAVRFAGYAEKVGLDPARVPTYRELAGADAV